MKRNIYIALLSTLFGLIRGVRLIAQSRDVFLIAKNNIVWKSQSKDASGSMPCGGGDIGLNVWVEKGEVLFYIAKSDAFDENNALLKLGRVRIKITPDPFSSGTFSQILNLRDGSVYIKGLYNKEPISMHLWVDVNRPVIHVELKTDNPSSRIQTPFNATITYESWRTEDHIVKGKENNENSYKFAPQGAIKVFKDQVGFLPSAGKPDGGQVLFYHHNQGLNVFDATVHQQGLDSVKDRLYNPLKNRTFGGILQSGQLIKAGKTKGQYQNTPFEGWALKTPKPVKKLDFNIYLKTAQVASAPEWQHQLLRDSRRTAQQIRRDWQATELWWASFWQRSFIQVDPDHQLDSLTPWEMGRNYQLFRYMLACNTSGDFPTKFNGGLFTYDAGLVDAKYPYTPDFRNWGGGTFTAQNQRLVYYPMLKSGDFDLMRPAFEFYRRLLKTAELRSEVYWHHPGASFTEQLENYGLPNPSEYGWKRPQGYDPGMEHNAWLEYEWDTALEFCDMILKSYQYNGTDIAPYLPLVKSCLQFFDEHYRYLAGKRGAKILDAQGHLILYPGSAAETYKLTYNASSTTAALQTVLKHLLELPKTLLNDEDQAHFSNMLKTIPPITLGTVRGKPVIAPAAAWARINNTETPQLYPIFPWGIYGLTKPHLKTALNTWILDTTALKNRSYIGWKQDNIFAARLGLTREATDLTMAKFRSGPRRFPTFWGPGFDWVPDHNWGGSAMIGLQEMLMQTNGSKILLFPAWPKDWDVHFRLHAPQQTTIEACLKNGHITELNIVPAFRKADIVNFLNVVKVSE